MEHTKSFSRREAEVVALLLKGSSNKQIAAALHISERTVEFHLENIYAKTCVNSRVELILKLGKSTGDSSQNPVESTVDSGNIPVHNGKQKEFAMTDKMRSILIVITVLMGMVLIIAGIITAKGGAVVVGLIVSAVAIQRWIASRKQPNQGSQ